MNRQLELSQRDVHQLVLANGDLLADFMDQTNEVLGIRFPDEYLSRGSVYALVDRSGLICGGAIAVFDAPFRSIVSIPKEQIERAHALMGDESECAEINGVWLLSTMRSPFLSFAFWRQLISQLMFTNKQRFIFTFENANDRMKELSVWLKPEILYSGKTAKLEGMKTEGDETIAIVSRESLVTVLEMLDRRGIGKAKPQEQMIIQQIECRSKQAVVSQSHVSITTK